MTLILSVASYRNRPPASPLVAKFEGPSIAIGRGTDNDWSLPDPEVHLSKKHCVIHSLDGQYTITDISTNGVFVNGSAQPLGNGGTAVLRTGDRLLIGDYEIAVEIRASAHVSSGAPPYRGQSQRSEADPFGLDDIMDPGAVRPSPFAPAPSEFAPTPQDQAAGALGSNWLREYDPVPRPQQEPSPPQFGAHADHVPSVDAAYRPPNVSFDPPPIGSFDIPDNWQNAPDAVRAKPSPPPADWQNAAAMPNAPPARMDWQQSPATSNAPSSRADWQNSPAAPNSVPPSGTTPTMRDPTTPPRMDWPNATPISNSPPPADWQGEKSLPDAAPPILAERMRGETGPPPSGNVPEPFWDNQPSRDSSAASRERSHARVPHPQQRDIPPAPPRREMHAPPPGRETPSRSRDAAPPSPHEQYAPPMPQAPRGIPTQDPSWQGRAPSEPQGQSPLTRDGMVPARQQAPSPAPVAPAPGRGYAADAGWRAFLDGAGLDESAFYEDPVDLMRSLGRVFREMVGGLRDLLAIRDKIKTEYRVLRTVIQASNNNPLKFAIDGAEAANLLLSRPKPGHLAGPKAVNEAFNDLKAHEMAFMVGMQAAVTALLQEFDPISLRKRIDAQMGWDSLIPGARQSKYWSGYEEHYRLIASEISENARSTFGLAFAKAYEEQSKKL